MRLKQGEWWKMDSSQWILDGDKQITQSYELWLRLLGENLTSRLLWSWELSSDTRQTPFLQQVVDGVCGLRISNQEWFSLLALCIIVLQRWVWELETSTNILPDPLMLLESWLKTQQWSHFTFRPSNPRAFSKQKYQTRFSTLLFLLGITKGANRGYIIPQMAHEHRNNQTIIWNFPTRTCGEIDTSNYIRTQGS